MAKQEFSKLANQFTLDLHKVQVKEAARIVRTRISECYRHGISSIKCVFGSPDRFNGSIAEAVLDIALTDEKVLAISLAEWVYADEIDVSSMPIFLVLPLQINPEVTPLTPESTFTGFNASFEPTASLRLLCRMPFQPLRERYDWPYAARAIGGGCKEAKLKEFCLAARIVIDERGISLTELLRCADGYGRWSTKQKLATTALISEVTEQRLPPQDKPFYPQAQPRTLEALLSQVERHLSADQLQESQDALSLAADLVERDSQKIDYEALLGRLLLRKNAPECESHLLQADQLSVKVYGDASLRRIPILRDLASWYSRTGEVSELLSIVDLSNSLDITQPTAQPTKKRYAEELSYARMLRHNGMYQESVYVLRLFVWEALLCQAAPMPNEFPIPLHIFTEGKLSKVQAARLQLLFAMNCTDDGRGDFPLATAMLNFGHRIIENVTGQEVLRAEIEQERGRIARMKGELDKAVRHYETAAKLLKDHEGEDLFLSYELLVSKGVVKAQNGQLKSASADYEKAWAIAEKLGFTDHLYVSKLLYNRATLALRKEDFLTCVRLASETADLLLLKATGRHKEIGLARFRQGEALCHLRKFQEARGVLDAAARSLKKAGVYSAYEAGIETCLSVAAAAPDL